MAMAEERTLWRAQHELQQKLRQEVEQVPKAAQPTQSIPMPSEMLGRSSH